MEAAGGSKDHPAGQPKIINGPVRPVNVKLPDVTAMLQNRVMMMTHRWPDSNRNAGTLISVFFH